ncbi:hypothetical protein [Phenylobacterium sp.]|uniref:hypothetical protein n=1 Tax=Phenylobacterium sp. TaxID=1871053 RepID=UPI00260DE6AA|nr:hypothetical protein [Phenylobacterium sp.]
MTLPIDPLRQIARLRRVRAKTHEAQGGADEEHPNLPVPAGSLEPAPPPAPITSGGPATFTAHVMGAGEQRRGLRGGPPTLNAARNAYNQTEFSGQADRRARKGGMTRTDI